MQAALRTYRRLFLVLGLLGFLVDQGSKYGIFAYLYNDGKGGEIKVLHKVDEDGKPIGVSFVIEAKYDGRSDPGDQPLSFLRTISGKYLPILNHGALFGIGGGNDQGPNGNHLFTLISLAAALAIVYWANRPGPASDRFLMVALGLILAGTMGNLYDRFVFGGVRDFLHFFNLPLPFGLDNWPVFNIADCCLVCGAGLLVVQAFFMQTVPAPEQPQEAVVQGSATAIGE
jgi:signal peptidase II